MLPASGPGAGGAGMPAGPGVHGARPGMAALRTSVNLSRLRHSDLIYFTETAVIDPFILSSIDHAVNLRPALPENAGAHSAHCPEPGERLRRSRRWPPARAVLITGTGMRRRVAAAQHR